MIVFASDEESDLVKLPERLHQVRPAGEVPLTSERAVQMALELSPTLRATRGKLATSRGEYRRDTAQLNPQLSVGASYVPHVDPGSPVSQLPDTDLTFLSQTFSTSGRRHHKTIAAEAALRSTRADVATAEMDLVQAVRLAYIDLQGAQATALAQEIAFRTAATSTDLADRQVRAGAVPESNLMRSRLEEVRVEQDLLKARGDVGLKASALCGQIGLAPETPLSAIDALNPTTAVPRLEDLYAIALANRPEVRSAQAAVDAARAQIDIARSDRRPDLQLQSSINDQVTNSGSPPFRVLMSLPLWDRGQISGAVEAARAAVRIAESNRDAAQLQVKLDVVRAHRQVVVAVASLDLLESRVLPGTDELTRRIRTSFGAGMATLLEMIDAQRVVRQARIDAVSARADLARARAGLDRAIGVAQTAPIKEVRAR